MSPTVARALRLAMWIAVVLALAFINTIRAALAVWLAARGT